ncbi:SIMPL domain-containing protein [Alteromonas lipolytica]|uniref:SIMPL domain-containing protein n=1 Tax=Alteromonas lipolytica TaxID=1856405 RepID=A0A1E8FHR0_9ALTE|nr:SIMPL domain-containing protein [Alteromonas lipolytica]OFI35148.1 hypothetical protein BFC17_16525 [Alteromonas lipolytica]GGF57107.1 outer membrane protein [Alteromonas lipolytica]
MSWKVVLLAAVGLVLNFQTLAAERTLQVAGQGVISAAPDAYTLTMVIEERGAVVSKLNEQANHKLNAVVSFLLSQGITEDAVQSMSVNLSPWYEHTSNGRENKGFVLTRQVRVTSNQLQNYDTVLDGAMKRGINRIDQFEFINTHPDEVYRQALIAAVEDAKARASLIAKQMGVSISGVIAVTETRGYSQPPVGVRMRVQQEAAISLPGQTDTSATVNVTFAIEN